MSTRKKLIIGIVLGFILLLCLAIGLGVRIYMYNYERFPEGYQIHGVSMSMLTLEEAVQTLEIHLEGISIEPILLRYKDKEWKIYPDDIEFEIKYESTVNKAYDSLHNPIFPLFIPVRRPREQAMEVELKYGINEKLLEDILKDINSELLVPPQNAMFIIGSTDEVQVSNSKEGIGIDIKWSMSEIINMLFSTRGRTVVLRQMTVPPAITRQALENMNINGLMSEYSTYFNAELENRTDNIRLAANAIDGVIVRPGDIFSFNQIVGPRTKATGYKEAQVIVDSRQSLGVGGGICQVTSTLYNAILLADIRVVERYPHSIPVGYIGPGRDATVAYDYLDFRFANTNDSHVLIRTHMDIEGAEEKKDEDDNIKGRLTVKIYGNPEPGKEVRLRVSEYETLPYNTKEAPDDTLSLNERYVEFEGAPGYRAVLERTIIMDEEVVRTETISEDICVPRERVIRVGTGEIAN